MKNTVAARNIVAALTVCMSVLLPSAQLSAAGPFQNLDGAWRGTGQVELAGGNAQRISCRAYYNIKSAGSGLGFAIRCASPSNKFELRGNVEESNGSLSGTWEERTFNAIGNVSGTARSGKVHLAIDGAVSGSMRISFNAQKQNVLISTATEGLKGITINLRR